jgi:HEPN domain-containing protein
VRNIIEAQRWLKDAKACLNTARSVFPLGDYRATIQNAQLCIELSAKAIIAYFAEPVWRHDPSEQLLKLLEEHKGEIGEGLAANLHTLAQDAREAAPWHGWSVYGRMEPGGWVPAVDLCTEEKARNLLERAEAAFQTASSFYSWLGGQG